MEQFRETRAIQYSTISESDLAKMPIFTIDHSDLGEDSEKNKNFECATTEFLDYLGK